MECGRTGSLVSENAGVCFFNLQTQTGSRWEPLPLRGRRWERPPLPLHFQFHRFLCRYLRDGRRRERQPLLLLHRLRHRDGRQRERLALLIQYHRLRLERLPLHFQNYRFRLHSRSRT